MADDKKKVEKAEQAEMTETTQKAAKAQKPEQAEKGPGRNDPCPCGSGKRFKKCCLRKGCF